jgi:hypothetical protein
MAIIETSTTSSFVKPYGALFQHDKKIITLADGYSHIQFLACIICLKQQNKI